MRNLSLIKVNLHKITRLVMSRICSTPGLFFSPLFYPPNSAASEGRHWKFSVFTTSQRVESTDLFFLGPSYAQKDLISEKAWVFFVVEINEVLQDILHLSKRTYGSLYFCKSAANILNQKIFTFHKMFSFHFMVSSWWSCPLWANTHLECFYSSINPKGKYWTSLIITKLLLRLWMVTSKGQRSQG